MNIFQPRVAFKPFEYPEASEFKDAINHSYWLVSEWNFLSDIHDFRTRLSEHERQVIRDTLLAISQVEVAVKQFWGKIGEWVPKPEIMQVGATFSESEVRHADAYSHLLHVLGLNEDFAGVLEVPCIKARVQYLSQQMVSGTSTTDFLRALVFFSTCVENVSLFAQFAVIKSFNKHRAVLKDTDNVVQATQKEETLHALFGQWLVNTIRSQDPSLVSGLDDTIYVMAQQSYEIECGIIDWIFRDGDLQFLKSETLKEFVKLRINESVFALGYREPFTIDQGTLAELLWFVEELHADVHTDFFHKRPVTYAKKTQPITSGDLF